MAGSQALAALEMLVHLDTSELMARYVVFEVRFSDSLVLEIGPSQLPRTWRAEPGPRRLRALGESWVAEGKSAVLRVPSVVVPTEFNYLLNPRHPDFMKISISAPSAFRFDPRLKAR